MWLAPVFFVVATALQAPSTYAATTYNLPLLQETLEVIGGDIFVGITNLINGAGNFNDVPERKRFEKRPLYLQAVEQPGGIDGEDEEDGQQDTARVQDKSEESAVNPTAEQNTTPETAAVDAVPQTTASISEIEDSEDAEEESEEDQEKEDVESAENESSTEEEPAENKDVEEFESRPEGQEEGEEAEEGEDDEEETTDGEEDEILENEGDPQDDEDDDAKALIANLVHFAAERVTKKLDSMNY